MNEQEDIRDFIERIVENDDTAGIPFNGIEVAQPQTQLLVVDTSADPSTSCEASPEENPDASPGLQSQAYDELPIGILPGKPPRSVRSAASGCLLCSTSSRKLDATSLRDYPIPHHLPSRAPSAVPSTTATDHIVVKEKAASSWSGALRATKLEFEATPGHYPLYDELKVQRQLGFASVVVDRSALEVLNILSRHGYKVVCCAAGGRQNASRLCWTLAKESTSE